MSLFSAFSRNGKRRFPGTAPPAAAVLLGLAMCAILLSPARAADAGIPRFLPLVIESSGRLLTLNVEVADTKELRMRGLMSRQRLPKGQGMLLLWERPGFAALWMKNMLIPLDMIFMDGRGVIIHIHENARPGDLRPVSAGRPTLAVLEIGAGEARRLGLKVGDRAALPRRGAHSAARHVVEGMKP